MTQKVVTNDEEVTGSKKIVLTIFGTFGRYVTNLVSRAVNFFLSLRTIVWSNIRPGGWLH
jgi:hypothetical protein